MVCNVCDPCLHTCIPHKRARREAQLPPRPISSTVSNVGTRLRQKCCRTRVVLKSSCRQLPPVASSCFQLPTCSVDVFNTVSVFYLCCNVFRDSPLTIPGAPSPGQSCQSRPKLQRKCGTCETCEEGGQNMRTHRQNTLTLWRRRP